MELIRSLLFGPATRARFIEKAPSAGADVVCLDLEDAVAPAEKPRARDAAREAIRTIPRTGYQLYVRVNGLDTGLLEHDLDAIVGPQLDGISLPKVLTPQVLQQADAYLTLLEKLRDMPAGHTKIIIWLESAEAMMRVYDIVRASPRLVGAAYGAEDFTADMEVSRTKEA
ncbi:MAG: aldolase/citrate lyase family protein, partial [Chloroflexota bacterium]